MAKATKATKGTAPRIVSIRTSERASFRRCKRRWGLSSPLRRNRGEIERPGYFWIGTGGHFALEDFHGHNYYGHPVEAFKAYTSACKKTARKHKTQPMPDDWQEQFALGVGLLDYYVEWLQGRDTLKTLWVSGVPQVEVRLQIPLPIEHPDWDLIIYDATFDRVVVVSEGGRDVIYLVDYKFHKSFMTDHLDYDPQISAYLWAAQTIYDLPVEGFIYQQHRKVLASIPKILANGRVSASKDQLTTHRMYKKALIDLYGSVETAPAQNIECMNILAMQETEHKDRYITRDITTRNQAQLEAQGTHVLMEIGDMLNKDLALYPSPTKDCSWDCQFRDVCLMLDRDDDWEQGLNERTAPREEVRDIWRQHL